VLASDATAQGLLLCQRMEARLRNIPPSAVKRELLLLPCVNVNGGESSSDLCTVKRAAGAGLVTQANKGAVAKASKVSEATCVLVCT